MNRCRRIFVELALAIGLLVPVALAQKPPAPAPRTPPSTPPGRPTNPSPLSSDPNQPGDLVMFLQGRVATNDGTPVPNDAMVERVCNNNVRQQVYASSKGDFSMQLGSRTTSVFDATGDPSSPSGVTNTGKDSLMGIPRRDLTNCELRASAAGFRSTVISLVELDTFGSSIDVGAIVVQRLAKMEGTTLNAAPYKAPRDASKAYEKGLQAERNGKHAIARKYFERAVQIYPGYAIAWFQLGAVLQKEDQNDAARSAYIQATAIDTKFLPPYLSLALIAYEAKNWPEVLKLTGHILDLDPLNKVAGAGYILDLDPLNYTEAYFYHALANFKLNKMEDAEKSALKAEHLDLRTHFPHVHLLLADIFARRNNYAGAILQLQTYLELAPHAQDTDQVREQLAKWEKLNASASASEKPE